LKETGVLLIPGTGFGPSMSSGLRLSYGPLCYEHEQIIKGIETDQSLSRKNRMIPPKDDDRHQPVFL
jgi:aspartate/methionine/tyrosine aminotransferase